MAASSSLSHLSSLQLSISGKDSRHSSSFSSNGGFISFSNIKMKKGSLLVSASAQKPDQEIHLQSKKTKEQKADGRFSLPSDGCFLMVSIARLICLSRLSARILDSTFIYIYSVFTSSLMQAKSAWIKGMSVISCYIRSEAGVEPPKPPTSTLEEYFVEHGSIVLLGFGKRTHFVKEELVETLLDSVKWDNKGLAITIAQNVDTGAILMQGFANRDALATTISSRKATFYSRSRSSLWTKGEISMNFIDVHDIFLDCDRDSIIYLGKPHGPSCHTGSETCYYSSVDDILKHPKIEENRLALTTLYSLEDTIAQRRAEIGAENGKPSWTKRLLLDQKLCCSKIREEADELCQTLEENEDKSRAVSEMADVLYHAMVLLALKDVKVEEVLQVLRQRFSQSGIEEKNHRKS